jgi:zinc-ribbon domain
VADCRNCGAELPTASRYCPQCGRPSTDGTTDVLDLPTDETGVVPVNYARAEPRYYGVTPATLVLVLAAAALALAIYLLVTGHWPIGLILLGVALLLLVLFLEAARRGSGSGAAVAQSTGKAIGSVRARAGAAAGSVAIRGRATGRLITLRREVQRLAVVRQRLLFELGEAVYRGDDRAAENAREQVKELDQLAAQREEEMSAVMAEAYERIQQRRLEVRPTEMVEVPEGPDQPSPGGPATPEPARIPEPYPPPDEGTPPQPAIIPEPGPAVIPEPGPEPPEGERHR